MLVVETVARVRRAYFVQEKSIKEIARDLKVSRKTVRKVIRSGATSFHYARGTQPAPKLGPWRDWSHEVVLIDGVTVKIKVAHVRLCHSRMPFVRAYPRR